ncbi:MAG: flagellar hook-basal body protein [Vampirovibrionales bacterium]|nr:flagellar hook-basal body protein [Vampirovibrionales bacterium]
MLKGIYTIASSLMAQEVASDVMANNVANMNTNAFKRSMVSFQTFPDLMIQRVSGSAESGKQNSQNIGSIATGSKIYTTQFDFSQGDLYTTGNAFHIAIQGDAFFNVRDPNTDEITFTRNGSLDRDSEGYLATLSGQRLQGEQGDIAVPPGAFIEFMPNGVVRMNGEQVDTLVLTAFENNKTLEMKGDSLFAKTASTVEKKIDPLNRGYKVQQGTLEHANVNPIKELMNTMVALRSYESMQKNIQAHNETLGQAINQMARP